jgi:hypothetical protein
MNRRSILLGSTAALAAPAILKFISPAFAANTPDPSRLNGDLMPFGGERAGNASGTIPAWTGGCVKDVPSGWTGDTDPYGDDKPLYSVTASNVDQYADMLSAGQIALLKRYGNAGYRLDVYPTRRSACGPQYVYDNTYKNVTRAQAYKGDIVTGFTGAVCGLPFPILSDDPAVAGAQAMWNHGTAWRGNYYRVFSSDWVIGGGQRSLESAGPYYAHLPFFDPDLTPETYDGIAARFLLSYTAPPSVAGGKFLAVYSSTPATIPNNSFEYLVGEGRIREAPDAQYDIPVSFTGDAIDFDEASVFLGKLDRYTWKLLGKKEMIVPYNAFKSFRVERPEDLLGLQFLNPDVMRFELHRCYVVEAKVAPGARMTEPRRIFYLDEDTGFAVMGDTWDDQGNFWKHLFNIGEARPDLPGQALISSGAYNLQSKVLYMSANFYNVPAPIGGPITFQPWPASMFYPQALANSGGL